MVEVWCLCGLFLTVALPPSSSLCSRTTKRQIIRPHRQEILTSVFSILLLNLSSFLPCCNSVAHVLWARGYSPADITQLGSLLGQPLEVTQRCFWSYTQRGERQKREAELINRTFWEVLLFRVAVLHTFMEEIRSQVVIFTASRDRFRSTDVCY